MKNIVISVIESGRYNLTELLRKIDTLWLQGSLTDEDKEELVAVAQSYAKVENSVDVLAKLSDLEQRVQALEGKQAESQDVDEYKAGVWYYTGNKVSFNGNVYECIAPTDKVCTWSPAEYPAYWSEV